MGRRAVTPEQVAVLLRHFREHGAPTRRADFAAAGEVAGCDPRTVRRAWERGWARVPSLRDHLAEERVLARAELTRAGLSARMAEAPGLAMEDAAQTLAREAHLARLARDGAVDLLGVLPDLRRSVVSVAARLATQLEQAEMAPAEAIGLIRSATSCAREVVEVAFRAVQLERLRLGDPTETLAVAVRPVLTLDEVEATVAAAQRALARAQTAPSRPEVIGVPHGDNGCPIS
jgi:hypothetical protein